MKGSLTTRQSALIEWDMGKLLNGSIDNITKNTIKNACSKMHVELDAGRLLNESSPTGRIAERIVRDELPLKKAFEWKPESKSLLPPFPVPELSLPEII